MSKLREQMQLEMNLKGFSERTKKSYIGHVKRFSEHCNKSPDELGTEAIKAYLNYLIVDKKVSSSYVNSAYSAIKFLNVNVLNYDWDLKKIPRMKNEKKLPVVLTETEVSRILKSVSNIKHLALLTTTYSAGLRVSEVVHLKPLDIDSNTMQIRVNQGKGKKDVYLQFVRKIARLTTKVALRLNMEQIKTKRNGKWTAKTIGDVLKNPFYIGTYRYNYKTGGSRRLKDKKEWVLVENNHPGIVRKKQFERVNKMLSDNYKAEAPIQGKVFIPNL